MKITIKDMPLVEVRESTYDFDTILRRLSSINTEHSGVYDDTAEALLCIANEIKSIKLYLNYPILNTPKP